MLCIAKKACRLRNKCCAAQFDERHRNVFQTEQLIDIEYQPDNTDLITQGIVVAVSCVLMIILGIWYGCHNREYSDDLQKA